MQPAPLTTRAAMYNILDRVYTETNYQIAFGQFYTLAFRTLPDLWHAVRRGDDFEHEMASNTAQSQVINILVDLNYNPPPFTSHFLNLVIQSVLTAEQLMQRVA